MITNKIPVERASEIARTYTAEYAKYVATGRAVPSLVDGLKPVQRRCINSALDLKIFHDKKFLKSAKLEGQVIGDYSPHGGVSLTGLVQPFKIRYPLLEGQGNWGSPDDPGSVAASRYTEVRLTEFCEDFYLSSADYADRDDNYDHRLKEITLYYPALPGVLFTGADGIAVGLSTKIPPHNLKAVGESFLKYLDSRSDFYEGLQPDTCEGSVILSSKEDIKKVYEKGEGSIRYGAKTHYETIDDKPALVVDAFPPDFTKKRLETPFILNAVESGSLELLNESAETIRYVFISSDKSVLEAVEKRLETSVGYRFYIEHHGVIHLYNLKEIYDVFIEEKSSFVIRKYTNLLLNIKEDIGYLEALIGVRGDKEFLKSLLDLSTTEAVSRLKEKFSISDPVAKRVLSTPIRSLLSDNTESLLKSSEEKRELSKRYESYIEDPRGRMIQEVKELLVKNKKDKPRALHVEEVSDKFTIKYQGKVLQIYGKESYFVGSSDNTYQQVYGEELRNFDLSGKFLVSAEKSYYVLYDGKGACGVTRDVMISGVSKLKSDTLCGILALDSLASMKVRYGNGKEYLLGDWILRQKLSYIRFSKEGEPEFCFLEV